MYFCQIELPNRSAAPGPPVTRDKLLVVLQGGVAFAGCTEVAVVIGSTWRGGQQRPFEVVMGDADGFHHDTVVDCRWPFTLPKTQVEAGRQLFKLSDQRMHEVSIALVRGLQIH